RYCQGHGRQRFTGPQAGVGSLREPERGSLFSTFVTRYKEKGGKYMPQMREITSGLQFPEGPVAMDDGSVLVVEVTRGTLTGVRPNGAKEVVAETGGGPNGAAIGPDGMVYICNNGGFRFAADGTPTEGLPEGYTGGYIQRVDLASGKVEVLYTECNGHR